MLKSDYYFSGGYNAYKDAFDAVEGGGPILTSTEQNLVDVVWEADAENTRPAYPDRPLIILDAEKYTGMRMLRGCGSGPWVLTHTHNTLFIVRLSPLLFVLFSNK